MKFQIAYLLCVAKLVRYMHVKNIDNWPCFDSSMIVVIVPIIVTINVGGVGRSEHVLVGS